MSTAVETQPSATRRSAKAAGLSAVTRAATFPLTAASALLTASLTIQYAGAHSYAAIATLVTLSQLLPFADLGVGAGVVNAVSSGNRSEARRAVAAAIRILVASAMAMAVIALAIGWIIGWDKILGVSDAPLAHSGAAAMGVILIIAVSLPFGVGQRVLIGAMRNPTAIALSALAPIATLAGTVAVIAFDLTPTLLVFPPVIGSLIVALISSLVASRIIGSSMLDAFRPRRYRYPGLLRIGGWYLLLTLSSAVAFQSGRIILAHAADLNAVAEFSLAMQFYVPIWSFFVAGGTALWPVFARMRSSNTDSRKLLLRMASFFLCAALLCGVGLIAVGPWFAHLLAHGDVQPNWGVFAGTAALIMVQSVQLVQGVSLTNRAGIRFQALFALPMIAAVPALTWIGAAWLGASSPFVAAAVGVALFQVLPNSLRLRGDKVEGVQAHATSEEVDNGAAVTQTTSAPLG